MQRLGLQGVPPLKLAKHAIKNFLANDMLTYSAALAYSMLFALFPFLIFLIALLGALNIERFFDWMLQTAGDALPESAFSMVETVIGEVRGQSNGGVLSIDHFRIWAASSGVRSVMNAMNVAFHADETRPMLRRYVLSVIFTE
ncbi:MAG: YhjD/YihY/BrkB family envelope integrity protein [Thermomicrobiales bacterium]